MKKLVMIISLMSLMVAFFIMVVPAVMADTISPNDYVKLVAYNSLEGAGIMTYAVSHDTGITTAFEYDTFCIQENVYVLFDVWYPVADVSDNVGYLSGNELKGVVDYLFYRYKSGVYDDLFDNNKTNQADFQKLIWSLQDNGSYSSSGTALWTSDMGEYNSQTDLQHSWGTKVINIVSSTKVARDIQNQLYNQVPEPTTMLLLGIGLVGLAGVRKKIQSSAVLA